MRAKSVEDEIMLKIIGNPDLYQGSIQAFVNLHVYDVRPFINALGNRIIGKGYENEDYYKNIKIDHLAL